MLNRTIAKFLFYFVAVILLAWTASLTVSFLRMALPGAFWIVPILGLIVFDVGMVSWLFVFLSHAEGAIQRATAIMLTVFDFLGVALMVLAEILLDGQQLIEAPPILATAAIWGIAVWTVVNVGGVIVFHLGDNNARRDMAIQAEKDALFEGALADLRTRRVASQARLANEMGGVMFEQLVADLRSPAATPAADTGNTGNPYGLVTNPELMELIDNGSLPPQPPIAQPNGKAPSKNGRGR